MTLIIFELIDGATVMSAGWLIARMMGGGPRVRGVLQFAGKVDPLALIAGDDEHEESNVIPFRPKSFEAPEGVEWPTSPWRPALSSAPAVNSPSA